MLQYEDAITLLQERLPMFAHQGGNAIKKSLANINRLCAALGNPQNNFPTVHIAGTNGKGSVCHLLAAAFQHNGYRTGLYTSPHLTDLRERFRIDGTMVSRDFVVEFINRTLPLIEEIKPSYFELTVAMAFCAFSEANVDIAIIETGMGGRLDSTNILHPVLSLITNIGLDHTQYLGTTLEAIAGEKAGIIKPGTPVLIGETQPETENVFIEAAFRQKAPLFFADQLWGVVRTGRDHHFQYFKCVHQLEKKVLPVTTDLLGNYQQNNVKTALAAIVLLQEQGWRLPLETTVSAFSTVKDATGLRGRWEIIQQHPRIILDVAHNEPAAAFLENNLNPDPVKCPGGHLHIILGFVKDKKHSSVLPFFPTNASYYFTRAQIPRALAPGRLAEQAKVFSLKGATYPTVDEALDAALANASREDTLLITGSFFIVGEALRHLERPSKLKKSSES